MGAYSLSPCIRIGLWTGFRGVHGKENALSFYALGTTSDARTSAIDNVLECVTRNRKDGNRL